MSSERPNKPLREAPVPTPPGHVPGAPAAGAQDQRRGGSSRLVWTLLGVVLVLALFVVFVLPYMSSSRSDAPQVAPSPQTPAPQPENDSSVARHEAEQALQAYLRLRSRPQLADADQWGEPQWSASLQAADEGDQLMGRQQYAPAAQAYLGAGRLLQELEDDRQQRFEAFLAGAETLLAENQSRAAGEQFRLALFIEPGHGGAQKGLERARVHDQVMQHMRAGEQAEAEQRLEGAVDSYRAAVALDSDWQAAREALAKVEAQQLENRFLQAVNQALAGLDAGRTGEAGEALQRAAKIHPDAPVVTDLQHRLAAARKQASLGGLRSKAQGRVEVEDWSAAVQLYRKALAIEPGNSFAGAGLARARDRVQLHQQLDHYLADPVRIYSPEPLANARRLLAGNTSVPAAEPKLQKKVSRLRELVRMANQPREVILRSDGQTEVAIYHVRRLGSFTEQRLSLLPGKYTVVGSRPGYRDVRRVFMVLPGKPVPAITIRCEEPL